MKAKEAMMLARMGKGDKQSRTTPMKELPVSEADEMKELPGMYANTGKEVKMKGNALSIIQSAKMGHPTIKTGSFPVMKANLEPRPVIEVELGPTEVQHSPIKEYMKNKRR